MEEFNFNDPINATIIFDDSDDETKPTNHDLLSEQVETNGSLNTLNELIPIENRNTLSDKTNIVEEELRYNFVKNSFKSIKGSQNHPKNNINTETLANNTSKQLDMPSLEDDNNTLQNLNGSIINNNNNSYFQNKPDNQRNNKRKKSTDGQKSPKRRLTKDLNPHVSATRVEVQGHNTASSEINQNCFQDYNLANNNNIEMVMPNSQKENNQTEKQLVVQTVINQNAIQDFNLHQQNTDILLAQSQNETGKTVINYLKELLNVVTEHMISILNSYFSYMRIFKNNVDHRIVEHAYSNYVRTKEHFFDLSYSTIANIVLPRENDAKYVNNFVYHTVKVACAKTNVFSYNAHIKPLFTEMIGWVKRKREKIQSMNLNKSANPLLVEQLQKAVPQYPPPSQSSHDQQIPDKPIAESNTNYIYSCRMPPGGNADPTCLYKQSIQKQQNSPGIMPTQYTKQYNYENTSSKLNDHHQHLQSQINNLQRLPNFSDIHSTTSSWPKHAAQSWQFMTTESSKKQATLSLQKDIMSTQNFPQNQEELHVSVNNQNLRPDNPVQIEPNRSSISRDSGFMSPLNFTGSSDQMWNFQEEQTSQLTPLITHVTSLNPKVSYISDGLCSVCGQITKKKCLGCYKSYYCSHACQYLDWKKHMAVCK